MKVETVHESTTYVITLHIDEATRDLIRWDLNRQNGALIGREAIATWVQHTLLRALEEMRSAHMACNIALPMKIQKD